MSCGIEVLAIAFSLAQNLVQPPASSDILIRFDVNGRSVFSAAGDRCASKQPVDTPWFFGSYPLPESERYRCLADIAEKQETEARYRAADYREFQRIVTQCKNERPARR
jgi:hypothetical protein